MYSVMPNTQWYACMYAYMDACVYACMCYLCVGMSYASTHEATMCMVYLCATAIPRDSGSGASLFNGVLLLELASSERWFFRSTANCNFS